MKKGQVTIFVIIGIVLLFIAGLAIYLYSNKISSDIIPERTTVSEQFKPIQLFFEGCLENVAREAIEKLGRHGGYIDPNDDYLSGRTFYTDMDDQSKSDLAYLSKDPDKAVAYWYYSYDYPGCDDCLIMSQAPYLDEIKRQINVYVSENMGFCLNNFDSFRNQGYIIETADDILVKTTLRDEDVVIESVYEINLTYGNSRTSMEKYISTVDIPLMKYYEMAINITSQQYDSQFLEGLNTYIMLSHSGLDSNLLPPVYDYSSGYAVVYWSKSAVEQNIKQLLISYVPAMQVVGTKRYVPITGNLTLMEKNFIDLITLDLFPGRNMAKTDISFIYLGQDLSFDINPSKNELLGPTENKAGSISVSPPKETNTYQFFYDISYPVIVEIKDEYKPGEYYTFMFALESTIKENLPLREWWNSSKQSFKFNQDAFEISIFDSSENQKVVDRETGENYTYKPRVGENLFCEQGQRVSGNVTLKTYDASTKQPLSNVDITFGCGNYASCSIGKTEHNSILNVESFNGKMPICMNGYLQLEKFGYQKKIMRLTTTSSNTNLGSIYLEPVKEINVTLKVYKMNRMSINGMFMGFVFPTSANNPGKNDSIFVTLERMNTGLDEPISETVAVGPNINNTIIKLVPGRYTISGTLMVAEGYTIPKECKPICDSYFLGVCTGHKYVPENDMPVPNAMLGGIELTNMTPFTVSSAQLSGNKTLEIYLIQLPPPPCIDEMDEINKIGQLSQRYRSKIMPVFK